MRQNIDPMAWPANLADFSERNKMRPTRLEVMGLDRDVNSDFWLENGLLFAGIDLDMDGNRGPAIEIMLQAPGAATHDHMTHTVSGVKRMELDTADGRDEALAIEDQQGMLTIMRFECEVTDKTKSVREVGVPCELF